MSYFQREESLYSHVFPGYHSVLDNFNTTKRFVDPNFTAHKTLAEVRLLRTNAIGHFLGCAILSASVLKYNLAVQLNARASPTEAFKSVSQYRLISFQVITELTLRLSTSTKLPLDCREMSKTLEDEFLGLVASLSHSQLNPDQHFSLGRQLLPLLCIFLHLLMLWKFPVSGYCFGYCHVNSG